MKNIILTVAAASAMMTISSFAQAIEYPFCGSTPTGRSGVIERCEYTSMEQCRASVSGLGGSCAANWRYAFMQPVERPAKRRVRERTY